MTKILTIVGARPQFIKASAVTRELHKSNTFDEVLVHTGQHFDAEMSAVFFEELGIPSPAYDLGINELSHGAMTGRMLEAIEALLPKERPSLLLVYGDTNSTLAGALAASKKHIPVLHVEAGLRSFDKRMPEEINRVLTDHVSTMLFCPTTVAVENLRRESIVDGDGRRVLQVGDVMLDVALEHMTSFTAATVEAPYAVCTLHRAENTDDPNALQNIVEALDLIAREIKVILPLHPRTKLAMERDGIKTSAKIMPPQSYKEMLSLVAGSELVLTDSGGLQKEAYFLKRPCITLRTTTEWTELVDAGCNVLAGSQTEDILRAFRLMKVTRPNFDGRLYGDGSAAKQIVAGLTAAFG